MNLDNAIQTHAAWKVKFRLAIAKREQMDVATIARDNQCEIGQWLLGEAKNQYGRLASHGECVKAHAQFHAECAKVATAINGQQLVQAEAMLSAGSSHAAASKAMSVAFLHLKKETGL
jgi:hypothetical protein